MTDDPLDPSMPPTGMPPEKVFNRFCRAFEHEIAWIREKMPSSEALRQADVMWRALERAPVLYFDNSMYAAAMAAVKSAELIDLRLPPLMPFPEVALVDSMGAVLMWDTEDFERGQEFAQASDPKTGEIHRGSILRRMRVAVFQATNEPRAALTEHGLGDRGMWHLGIGTAEVVEPDLEKGNRALSTRDLTMTTAWDYEANEPDFRGTVRSAPPEVGEAFRIEFTNAVGTALDELYYVDLPRHHLIIEEPLARSRKRGGPKLPRADDRQRVRLIEPERIHVVRPPSGAPVGTRDVRPHPRRGHTKYLTSEHWKEKRWTRIRVRPSWVGEQEWTVGKFQYRVVIRPNDKRSL